MAARRRKRDREIGRDSRQTGNCSRAFPTSASRISSFPLADPPIRTCDVVRHRYSETDKRWPGRIASNSNETYRPIVRCARVRRHRPCDADGNRTYCHCDQRFRVRPLGPLSQQDGRDRCRRWVHCRFDRGSKTNRCGDTDTADDRERDQISSSGLVDGLAVSARDTYMSLPTCTQPTERSLFDGR